MTTGNLSATRSSLLSAPRLAAALAVLTACVFVVGTAEWVMVGLLPQLSADLHRPLPVGSLVTWYALVVTVAGGAGDSEDAAPGTPPRAAGPAGRVPRRHTDSAVTTLLALFGLGAVVGNVLGGRLADRAPPGRALC